jgi:hypothetical protein
MAAKRESPVKPKAKKKTVKAGPFDGIAAVAPEDSDISNSVSVDGDPDVRRQLVAMEAYYLAERRGFAAGHEEEDWMAAEAAVRSRHASDPAG